MPEYMLDTSAIGEIADGAVCARALYTSTDQFYVTHLQEDELADAGSYAPVLKRVLEVVDAESVRTYGFVSGISQSGRAGMGGGVKGIERALSDDGGNELVDAILANTAIRNDYVLVTHDGELRRVVTEETPGSAVSVPDFAARI